MKKIGIRALKQNASAVAAEAAAGETMLITDRGRPVAQITPLTESALERLAQQGRLRPPRRPLSELPTPLAGPAVSEALAAMRDAEPY